MKIFNENEIEVITGITAKVYKYKLNMTHSLFVALNWYGKVSYAGKLNTRKKISFLCNGQICEATPSKIKTNWEKEILENMIAKLNI